MSITKLLTSLVLGKQKRPWTLIVNSSSAKTFTNLATSGYTEVYIELYWGGLNVTKIVPVSVLTTSNRIFNFTYAGGYVDLNLSLTNISMYRQPAGYTAVMTMYAR